MPIHPSDPADGTFSQIIRAVLRADRPMRRKKYRYEQEEEDRRTMREYRRQFPPSNPIPRGWASPEMRERSDDLQREYESEQLEKMYPKQPPSRIPNTPKPMKPPRQGTDDEIKKLLEDIMREEDESSLGLEVGLSPEQQNWLDSHGGMLEDTPEFNQEQLDQEREDLKRSLREKHQKEYQDLLDKQNERDYPGLPESFEDRINESDRLLRRDMERRPNGDYPADVPEDRTPMQQMREHYQREYGNRELLQLLEEFYSKGHR